MLRLLLCQRATRVAIIIVASIIIGLWTSALFGSRAIGNNTTPATQYRQAVIVRSTSAAGSNDQAQVRLLSGPTKGREFTASIGSVINSLDLAQPLYTPGQRVMVSITSETSSVPRIVVIDHYRLTAATWIVTGILVLSVIFAGIRGVGSLLGLLFSMVVIGKFIIPQIIHGHSPYVTTAVGILIITLVGMYTAHGLSRRTSIALAATYITLMIAVGFSNVVITMLHSSGISSENTFFLNNLLPGLDIRGLLLCGTIISLVGILDDITVAQVTAVQELQTANPSLIWRELYRRGLRIGREHIASLINTLVLAYVGSSFIFVVYISATSQYPLLVNLNTEVIMEELARSLIGSATLIIAIPVSTLLAARYVGFGRK